MELWLDIILSISFLFFSLDNLKKRQKYCEYLLPGWIIVILIFVYSVPASFTYAIDSRLLNVTFNRSFTYESILGCQRCSTVVLAAYFLSEFMIKMKNKYASRNYEYIKRNVVEKNYSYKVLVTLLFAISVFLYIQRWSSVGGIGAMILMGRADALYEMDAGGGGFARYDISFFLSVSFFLPYLTIKRKSRDLGFVIVMMGLYVLFFIVILMSGTRLPIVSIFFCAFAFIFTFAKEWLNKRKKTIILSGIILYFLFNVYSFFRSDVFNIVDSVSSTELTAVEIFLPNETLTSYLSYDAMIQYPEKFYENQFFKIIPSSIRSLIGLGTFVPYSARLQDIRQTVSTLTVPLPVDLYFGTRGIYLLLFLLALFTFLLINRIFVIYSQKRFGAFMMMWTYLISFYFIRTESIAWFSRGLLLFLFGLPLLFFLRVTRKK